MYGWMSGSLTEKEGIALVEGLCDLERRIVLTEGLHDRGRRAVSLFGGPKFV
jgi:hypothetical protein